MNIKPINGFMGKHRWLSNFWLCDITFDGLVFPSVENAYQALKTKKDRDRFTTCSPGEAKRLGRTVVIRKNWGSMQLRIMRELLGQKFRKGSSLSKKLASTGDRKLMEGNVWGDFFWGVCDGKGCNHLGKILMDIRLSLKERPDK